MKTTFSIICFSFIALAIVSSSEQIKDSIILRQPECFVNYMPQFIGLNKAYEDSFLACYDKHNINREPLKDLDPQNEMEKYKQISEQTCFSLTACNIITDLAAFFNCHSITAEENAEKVLIMQLNASSLALELNDQFDGEKKEILRCQLLAKREFLTKSLALYKQHLHCLNTFTQQCAGKM